MMSDRLVAFVVATLTALLPSWPTHQQNRIPIIVGVAHKALHERGRQLAIAGVRLGSRTIAIQGEFTEHQEIDHPHRTFVGAGDELGKTPGPLPRR